MKFEKKVIKKITTITRSTRKIKSSTSYVNVKTSKPKLDSTMNINYSKTSLSTSQDRAKKTTIDVISLKMQLTYRRYGKESEKSLILNLRITANQHVSLTRTKH